MPDRGARSAMPPCSLRNDHGAMPRKCALQSRRGGRWCQQGLGKALLVGRRQAENFRLLNGSLRRVLHRGNDKVCEGTVLKRGGALEQRVELRADTCLQTGC